MRRLHQSFDLKVSFFLVKKVVSKGWRIHRVKRGDTV